MSLDTSSEVESWNENRRALPAGLILMSLLLMLSIEKEM